MKQEKNTKTFADFVFGEFVNKTKKRKLRVYDQEDEETRRISLKLDNDARKKVVDALESIEDRLSPEQIIIILQDCLKKYQQMKKSFAYLKVPYDHDKDMENQRNLIKRLKTEGILL